MSKSANPAATKPLSRALGATPAGTPGRRTPPQPVLGEPPCRQPATTTSTSTDIDSHRNDQQSYLLDSRQTSSLLASSSHLDRLTTGSIQHSSSWHLALMPNSAMPTGGDSGVTR